MKENREGKSNLSINLLHLKLSVVDDTNPRSIMFVSGNIWTASAFPAACCGEFSISAIFFIIEREEGWISKT